MAVVMRSCGLGVGLAEAPMLRQGRHGEARGSGGPSRRGASDGGRRCSRQGRSASLSSAGSRRCASRCRGRPGASGRGRSHAEQVVQAPWMSPMSGVSVVIKCGSCWSKVLRFSFSLSSPFATSPHRHKFEVAFVVQISYSLLVFARGIVVCTRASWSE